MLTWVYKHFVVLVGELPITVRYVAAAVRPVDLAYTQSPIVGGPSYCEKRQKVVGDST